MPPTVLSEFLAITHPNLPPPRDKPTYTYFTTPELLHVTGVTKKNVMDWLNTSLLRPSLGSGDRGRIASVYNSHRFSERDLLVAAAISSFPSHAVNERRRLSEALYAVPTLHRYILVTKAEARLFDSLASFADPVEWSHPLIHILDLRALWQHIERRYEEYVMRTFKKMDELADARPQLLLPSGEKLRRAGSG